MAKYLKGISQNPSITAVLQKKNTEKREAEAWSETEVKEWFSKNNINLAILDHLAPCSGVVLKQIYDMNKRAPEFFYQSLDKIKGLRLNSISIFTHFLVKCFEETG